MSDETLDKEILEARRKLTDLQEQKRKKHRKSKPKSDRGRGRPKTDARVIAKARILARDFPIPDVALTLGVGLQTLYDHGIKRYRLDAEAANS
jgi:hypothetical protein